MCNQYSRRDLLLMGASSLFGNVLGASTGDVEQLIRTYYSGYEKKDWNVSGGVLADRFTFTSPNNDDHIGKSVFRDRCFLSQLDYIQRFELEVVLTRGDEAFVKYRCLTTKGTSFRNVEFFRFADGKITSIESYFGGHAGFAAAAARS